MHDHDGTYCGFDEDSIRLKSASAFAIFACYLVAHGFIFMPSVALWAGEALAGKAGTTWARLMAASLYWPPAMSGIACGLIWAEALVTNSVKCGMQVAVFWNCASYGILINLCGLYLAHWQGRLLQATARRAPPDALERIPTFQVNPRFINDDEDCCPICLAEWAPKDLAKITPCGHAFHVECLGMWLQTNRTCAMCRNDLSKPQKQFCGWPHGSIERCQRLV
jgi:hypothetical protein